MMRSGSWEGMFAEKGWELGWFFLLLKKDNALLLRPLYALTLADVRVDNIYYFLKK